MDSKKSKINIVWLKRDLRLHDHEPIFLAQQELIPVLFLYAYEPSLINYPDSSTRHWRFIYESIVDINERLKAFQSEIYIFHREFPDLLSDLTQYFDIQHIFSHMESGNKLSFQRDQLIAKICREKNIQLKESRQFGVIRGLKNRKTWQKDWEAQMQSPIFEPNLSKIDFLSLSTELYNQLKGPDLNPAFKIPHPSFQKGGERMAWRYFKSFLEERHSNYSAFISKPEKSRKSCSRLSPYLAYGNISMKSVFQRTMAFYPFSKNKRALSNFVSRLHWHCHFIQKFESECRMEFENLNQAYDALLKPRNETYIKAFENGITGIPIVDACIVCLKETGYVNFRMRALLVSFFVFNLWQDWRDLHILARWFLDYEPGIHYPQIQMQAGQTGVNTIRIYNPIKNSISHDPDAIFIKKWLPVLKNIPSSLIHEPWKLSEMEQKLYECELGKDYPFPIIDLEESRKYASEQIWSFRKQKAVQNEGLRILQKHTNPHKSKSVT
ncbi:MAG: deoxyribodipyrimidine photo-lyase/cryptochrome family protein [Bacteroidia bacterium]